MSIKKWVVVLVVFIGLNTCVYWILHHQQQSSQTSKVHRNEEISTTKDDEKIETINTDIYQGGKYSDEKIGMERAVEQTRLTLAKYLDVSPINVTIKEHKIEKTDAARSYIGDGFCAVSKTKPVDIHFDKLFAQSPTGKFSIRNGKILVLEAEKNQPVWVVYSVQMSNGHDPIIQFESRFAGDKGLLQVFWDNQLVYRADQHVHGTTNTWAYHIPIGPDRSEGLHQLSFRLDAFSSEKSSMGISRLMWENTTMLQSPCLAADTMIANVIFEQGDINYGYYVTDYGDFVRRW